MEFLLKDYAKEWLSTKKIYLKESTYYNYSLIIYNYILPYFENSSMSDIDENIIQEFLLYLIKNGTKNKSKGLSVKTTKDILMVLKMILRAADKKGIYTYKKLELRYPNIIGERKINIVINEEKQKLVQAIYHNMNLRTIGMLLCLQTGLRIGEVCSLQWQDIDLDYKLLHITKTIQRIFLKNENKKSKSKILISSPKTFSSNRVIPISDTMVELLVKFYPNNPTYYFLTGTNKFLEPHTYRVYYQKFLKENNLPYIKFHNLRHTFASNCINMGIDCKVVSELLGHASVKTTLDLYVHPQMEEKRHCIELISSTIETSKGIN